MNGMPAVKTSRRQWANAGILDTEQSDDSFTSVALQHLEARAKVWFGLMFAFKQMNGMNLFLGREVLQTIDRCNQLAAEAVSCWVVM